MVPARRAVGAEAVNGPGWPDWVDQECKCPQCCGDGPPEAPECPETCASEQFVPGACDCPTPAEIHFEQQERRAEAHGEK